LDLDFSSIGRDIKQSLLLLTLWNSLVSMSFYLWHDLAFDPMQERMFEVLKWDGYG
jgi:hypothetical protein